MGAPVYLLLAAGAVLLVQVHAQRYQSSFAEVLRSPRCQATHTQSQEGRGKVKKKGRVLLSLILGLKMLALSVAVPLIVALALYSAWKGVTISLLAFMIASIVGLKSLIGKSHDAHNVIVAKVPGGGQDQWWRRLDFGGGGLGGGGLGGIGLGALDPYRGYSGLQPF